MNSPFQPKKLNVPGLMGDDALNESLKQFSAAGNAAQAAAPPPTSAVEMAGKIQSEYLDKPTGPYIRNAITAALPGPLGTLAGALDTGLSAPAPGPAPVDPQQRAIDVRSDILSSLPMPKPLSWLAEMGALSPEQSQAEADARLKEAQDVEAADKESRDFIQQRLDSMSEEERAASIPGGADQAPREALIAEGDKKTAEGMAKANADAIAMTKDPALQPKQTWWLNAMQSGVKGMAQMGTGTASGALEVGEMVRDASGLDLLTGGGRSNMRAWVDTVDATINKLLPGDKARSKDFITQLSQGTGSMAGFLLAGYVGSAFGFPVKATTATIGALSQGDQGFKDAERFHASTVTKYLALIANGALGLTEAVPLDRMFTRAESMTGGLVSRMLKHTQAGSMEEFIQEFGQAVGQDVIARATYDEKRKFDLGNYIQQGVVGGITGGLVGAATTVLHNSGVSSQPRDLVPPEHREQVVQQVISTLQQELDKLVKEPDAASSAGAEPPVPDGFIRLYHSGSPGEGETGRWVSTNRRYASDYRSDLPLHYMDVPANDERVNNPDIPEQGVKQGFTFNFELTPDEATHLKEVDRERAPASTSQGEPNAAAVPADNAPLVDISPDVAAQVVPRESIQPEQAATAVPVGRDANGAELVVPQDVFASQSRAVTSTPAFKNWFGDSKVADESGAPLVVYHGTGSEIRAFDHAIATDKEGRSRGLGMGAGKFYLTGSSSVASRWAEAAPARGGGDAPNVVPAFVKIENPIAETAYAARYKELFGNEIWDSSRSTIQRDINIEKLDNTIKAEGVDGIVDIGPDGSIGQVAVFEPTQIKSAFNGGNFDPNNPDILANQGTAANRSVMAGEPSRPAAGVPTAAGAATSDVSLAGISSTFTKLLGLTVRQGRFTLKGPGVTGQYDRRTTVVRLKTQNDLSNLVHEAGHDIYFKAGDNLKIFIAGNDTALMKVADDLYGGDTNVMKKSTHVAEGFAEFFRVYTLNRAYAERHYQPLVDEFDTVLQKDAPQLLRGLNLIGQQYAAWLQLPSVQLVRNMIVSGQKTGELNAALQELQEAGFGTWMHEYARRAVDASINRNAALNDVVSQMLNIGQENAGKAIDLKRSEDPRVLQRLATNTGARAMIQTTDGVMGYNSTQPMTRGLREALLLYHGKKADQNLYKIDPKRQADFAAYIVALRGIDEYRRLAEGKIERPPMNATLGDLQVVVKEMEGKYGTAFTEAAKVAHEYGMGLWQKSYDAGMMTEETYLEGLDRQFYVPLQRDMSDKKASLGASALTGSASLVKRFRGSDRDIVDPMDVLMHKTFALEQIISRNEVFRTLGLLADRAGKVGALVERVPSKQLMGKQLSVKDVARQLTKDDTISSADAQDLMDILQASIDKENTIDMFRSEPVQTKGENILFGWENGRLAALQLHDGDLGADVVNVINGLGRENLPLFTGLLSATTSAFRGGIVSWPDFLAANFIKDQFSAFIITDVGFKPFYTGIKGVFDELRQRNWAKQYNAGMGAMGGMNVANLHKARIDRDITALKRKGYLAKAFTDGGIRGSLAGMARVIELTETGTRLGVYRGAFERARKDGLSEWDSTIEASYTATDMMDFGLNGSRMLLARRTIPFLNAQLQGLYKMMRTLGADEVRQRKGLNFVLRAYMKSTKNLDLSRTERQAINTGRKAWVKMASLGLISAALHFLFRDDPDYQEAGEYLRTTGWVIPMGDGRLFYIPKPYELAVLANFTERALESSEGDGEAMHRFMRGLAMTFMPPVSPPLVKTAVEIAANKDFFSDTEIVPSYMQALTPELQFNNYTSTFAKQLGHITGMSPLKIDHVMSSLGATAYRDVMTMYNATDPNRGNMDATDAPILRRFIRDTRKGSTSSQDFWKVASTLNGTLRSAELTYKTFLEAGNEHAANDFLNTLGEDEKAYAILATDFKADAKRLNPYYRARQLTTIVSAMRREMVTDLGLADTTTKTSPEFKLTAREKTDLDEALSEYGRREMRNTLVAMNAPGWVGKKMVNTQSTIALIGHIEPRVRDELQRRIAKAKVYDFKTITNYWPDVKNRLLRDRENTFLDDVVAMAKVMQ